MFARPRSSTKPVFFRPWWESGDLVGKRSQRRASEKSGYWHRRLLRARGERPSRSRAAEQRDELASLHSITSSVMASSLSGIWRPSAFAVLRLITSSYFTLIDPTQQTTSSLDHRVVKPRSLSQRDICQIVQSLKIRTFKSPRACIKQT
jgi:hypothetical protein